MTPGQLEATVTRTDLHPFQSLLPGLEPGFSIVTSSEFQ